MALKIIQKFLTKNDCYKAGRKITIRGLMVHSTATPGVMAARWYDLWNKSGISKCVHGFLDDKEFHQHLPWNHRAWHCGGLGNNTHIGIEWCEPKDYKDKTYFEKVWANGVELYAMLCKMYNLQAKDIISHKEGYKKGIASNHGDPDHWWKYHGKTMDDFRAAVDAVLKGGKVSTPITEKPATESKPSSTPSGKGDMQTTSIVTYLNSIGVDSSFANRAKLAAQHGIANYKGTAEQNLKLLDILRNGGKATSSSSSKTSSTGPAIVPYPGVIIKRGSRGKDVERIQRAVGVTPDGIFGPKTEEAVKAYQKRHGLVPDGRVGPLSWAVMF